jgi:hypothetical protein
MIAVFIISFLGLLALEISSFNILLGASASTDAFTPSGITVTNEVDTGVLAVAADVQQRDLLESGIQLQNWDITFKVGAGDANTYTAAKNGQPTFVTLDDNFAYEVDPFLQIEFADQTTQSVPLKTINNQLITEGNTDPPFLTLSPFDCQGNIAEGQTSICTIKVIFTEEAIDLISDFIDIQGISGGGGGQLSSANQPEGANIGIVGAALTGTKTSQGQLPVDVCKLTTASDSKVTNQFQPIGATYHFDGFTDVHDIFKNAKDSDARVSSGYPRDLQQQLIFDIYFDNNNPNIPGTAESDKNKPTSAAIDSIKLTPTNSIFKAKIYTDQEPFDQDPVGFSLYRIWTECEWISIANAQSTYKNHEQSDVTGTKFVPLGQYDPSDKSKLDVPSDLNKHPDPSIKLGTENQGLMPSTLSKGNLATLGSATQKSILNPPFVTCNNVFEADSGKVGNVISNYRIIAGVDTDDLKDINGEKQVSLRITVDLSTVDQALITDNNNGLVKLNLVVDPDERDDTDDVHVIPLALTSVITNCNAINFADEVVQDF